MHPPLGLARYGRNAYTDIDVELRVVLNGCVTRSGGYWRWRYGEVEIGEVEMEVGGGDGDGEVRWVIFLVERRWLGIL
jgi:hypothetical protein